MSRPGLAALSLLFGSLRAAAQPVADQSVPTRPEEAVRFRYVAPPECPSAEAFTARVRERTVRGREATAEELARTFAIDVGPAPSGFLGKIEFLDDSGAPVSRRVQGEDCDAVVSSLALITALALDATLRADPALRGEPALRDAEEPESQLATAPPPVRPAPVVPLVAPTPPPKAADSPALLRSARVGASFAFESLLPGPVVGLLGQLDFRNDWSLRLVAHYESAKIEVDAGREISVQLLGLETSVCPLRPRLGNLSFYPCVAFDVGSLRAQGVQSDELPSVESDTRMWLAAGPELRLAWEPAAPYWLELRVAEAVPLLQPRFQLENPRQIALDLRTVTVSGGLSGGLRFW